MTADVEGMITYEALVGETLKFGSCPPWSRNSRRLPSVSGQRPGIESSSFKFGYSTRTIEEMEFCLAMGAW